MPMLALMLLFSSLFGDGDGGGPTENALRSQILRVEAAQDAHGAEPMQLYHLRPDRILRLGSQRLPDPHSAEPDAGPVQVRVAQLWERVDGRWQIRRSISIHR